jgi:hypothetical protein
MTPAELKEWLGGSASQASGWSKDDGSGESIGHEVLHPNDLNTCMLLMLVAEWPQDHRDPGEEPEEGSGKVRRE